MKKYLTVQNAALAVLVILACLFSMEVGQHITLKTRIINGTKENADLAFYEQIIQKFLDLNKNPFHVIKNYGKIPKPDMIEGRASIVGKDKSNFNVNYLYISPVTDSDTSVITLRNLKTNKIINQWHHKKTSKSPFLTVPVLFNNNKLIVRGISNSNNITTDGEILYCLDKNSNILWKQDSILTHHSIEIGPEGDVWTCSRAKIDSGPQRYYRNDQILRVDGETGKILFAKRIHDIFLENPEFDLTHVNNNDENRYHLNDVQPVHSTTKYWKKGDLFLSLNMISTVVLYRPSTNKIIWTKTGFMGHQHDVNVVDSSKISIFDNNLYVGLSGRKSYSIPGTSQLLVYDFASDTMYVSHKDVFDKNDIATETQGRSRLFPADSILYVECTDKGFMTLTDLQTGLTEKFIIPHPEEKGKLSNLRWYRVYQSNSSHSSRQLSAGRN